MKPSESKKQPEKTAASTKKSINYWKIAFLVLVGILLGTTVFFASRIFQQRETGLNESAELVQREGSPVLTVNSNKSQVNQLIDFYLSDFQKDQEVTEEGNVQLKAKSLSIGTLDLPTSEVMKMIKRSFKFPEWIDVNADEQIILIRLDQFRMQNGLFIKANKINLVDDEIQMSLYLPAETEDE